MREVAIHLEDLVVATLQCPLEACNIGRTQAELATALHQMYSLAILGNLGADNIGSAIGRTIIDIEEVESPLERHHLVGHTSNILALVIGRNYNYPFHNILSAISH